MTEAEIKDAVRRRAIEADYERLWRAWHDGATGTMTDAMFGVLVAAQMPSERYRSPKPTDPARRSKRKAQRRARAITRKARR